jgi:bifunctional UDP-N-acetylglucosamine pyrophosphorylase/glucosamine-1-phosphate N-acetyltransferase
MEAPFDELRGINSRAELAVAEATVQGWLRAAALAAGVSMTAPETVFLSTDTALGPDVSIEPYVVFGPGVSVHSGAAIRAFSHLAGCTIGAGAIVGPYARLRPGTVIDEGAHVGNFVELKATRLGRGAKANHLTYLGDTEVGAGANIGAGTITCNYDGIAKHRTVIGERAFIGSDTALVAPVTVGAGAITAAGSVIVRDVPPDALAIARGIQVDKPGRAAEFRARKAKGSG